MKIEEMEAKAKKMFDNIYTLQQSAVVSGFIGITYIVYYILGIIGVHEYEHTIIDILGVIIVISAICLLNQHDRAAQNRSTQGFGDAAGAYLAIVTIHINQWIWVAADIRHYSLQLIEQIVWVSPNWTNEFCFNLCPAGHDRESIAARIGVTHHFVVQGIGYLIFVCR